jgi:hypothetical protein
VGINREPGEALPDCGRLIASGSYGSPAARSLGSQRSGGPQARFRRKTLERYGERCVVCGRTEAIEAHHLEPGAEVGVPLCQRCHRRVEEAKRKAASK